jgi:hypothetical protein
LLARLEARIETNTEKDREDLKGMMAEMNAKMDGNQAEMRSIFCTFRSELKETIQRHMRATVQSVRSEFDETTACNEATETAPDPRMMQSIKGHQESSMGEAAVMPVGEPRKWHRVCNMAAERLQKTKETTREYRGSRKKLSVACRNVFRRAKVARRKRKLVRKIRIQEK